MRGFVTVCVRTPKPLDFVAQTWYSTYMKNKTTLSTLAATGTALDLTLAEVRGEVTVKKLRTRGPRKGETLQPGLGGGRALGGVKSADKAFGVATGKGQGGTLTRASGLGGSGVTDLAAVQARYKRIVGAEQKVAAREEAALRRAAREAEAFSALDDLLADL